MPAVELRDDRRARKCDTGRVAFSMYLQQQYPIQHTWISIAWQCSSIEACQLPQQLQQELNLGQTTSRPIHPMHAGWRFSWAPLLACV